MNLLRRVYGSLPGDWRHSLKAGQGRWKLARGRFRSFEPEWGRLGEWLRAGDWTIDVGANLGTYAARMSELVGPTGRVIAFEPASETFSLLVRNARHFAHPNVTLLNLAAGDALGEVGFDVPSWDDGSANYYEAHVTSRGASRVLVATVDALAPPGPVRLVKIDAEGYEMAVVRGMLGLLRRDRPVVILERRAEAETLLGSLGYELVAAPGSPNVVAVPAGAATPTPVPPSGASAGSGHDRHFHGLNPEHG